VAVVKPISKSLLELVRRSPLELGLLVTVRMRIVRMMIVLTEVLSLFLTFIQPKSQQALPSLLEILHCHPRCENVTMEVQCQVATMPHTDTM
jgi:hypothetical protein